MGGVSDIEQAANERYRRAIGTPGEDAAHDQLRRVLRVNVPPPGWTPEEDRREELLAESEHLAMRRLL